jgi:hypothetical protein
MQKSDCTIKNFDDLPVVIGVTTISRILGVSISVAYQIVHMDGFPKVVVGKRRILIPKEKFVDWFNQMSDGKALGSAEEINPQPTFNVGNR